MQHYHFHLSLFIAVFTLRSRSIQMQTSGAGKTVYVTGASGYIASWVVKLLLLRGYSVNATMIQTRSNTCWPAKERLQLFRGELTEDRSFDSAMDACVAVFHTASPCFLDSDDPQAELIEPAVKGTLNVLSSCARASSVKRVVMTSSISAMLFNGRPVTPDTIVDETWFSDPDFCRNNQKWYGLSKAFAEQAALQFAKKKADFDLITICPGRVMGPLLQPTLNTSSALFFNWLTAETYVDASHGFANVKDVAEAHIRAMEMESASGRYCIVEREAYLSEILNILKEAYPTLRLPTKCVGGEPYMPRCKFSRKRAQSLDIKFTPLEESLKEMMESFKDKQFIRF